MNEEAAAPLFRGATRPVMFFGLPTEILLKVEAPLILLAAALWPLLHFYSLLFAIPVIVSGWMMRDYTKRDDQYMVIWFMEVIERFRFAQNKLRNLTVLPPYPLPHRGFMHD
ncbi:VirB3 family type IV secretion system protein [uncultured Cardiobacterium sp.]|uniref:VirB3 family type IV secretion system protein n=1 Tax=uncultured Cardiobacterium sp. TaxID=417619 RepID=UPI00261799A8|nr:VirB3 family type IV secretion system protein [uncultured Cardiobacterium sp.]